MRHRGRREYSLVSTSPAPLAPPLFPDTSCVPLRAYHNPLGPGRCASEACRNAARVASSAATLRRSCAAFGRPLLLLLLFRRFDAVAGAFEAVAPSPIPSALCVAVKLSPSSATSAPAPPLLSTAASSMAHSLAAMACAPALLHRESVLKKLANS